MELFGKSTRGKRLKSADRIEGTLPFVTAGEADEGVSAFIGNDVEVFQKIPLQSICSALLNIAIMTMAEMTILRLCTRKIYQNWLRFS